LQDPDTQQPNLFVLIGNTSKSLALRELFGIKKAWKFRSNRYAGEIHFHLDPSSIFNSRPILIADGDLPQQDLRTKGPSIQKCHETTRRSYTKLAELCNTLDGTTDSIYSRLLLPFADVICFFFADLGGFRQIARHLAKWLEKGQLSTIPRSTYPRVIIVTEKIPLGAEREKEAKKAFLLLLREETTHDLSEQISDIHVVALLLVYKVSSKARYRRLKECLLNRSNEVRRRREDIRTLFSATHFAAFFRYACNHFSQSLKEPFNFIMASRNQNSIAEDLAEHISNLLKHIKSAKELMEFAVPVIASSFLLDNYPPESHSRQTLIYSSIYKANLYLVFDSELVFRTLYKDVLYYVSKSRVMAFEGSLDVVLFTGFVNGIEN
jgi:hypothetical protein